MKALLHLFAALAFAGCAPDVKVTRIEPSRAGFDTRNPGAPLNAIDRYLTAAEGAWHRLDRNPADLEARRDYNFAVSRLLGTLRGAPVNKRVEQGRLSNSATGIRTNQPPSHV